MILPLLVLFGAAALAYNRGRKSSARVGEVLGAATDAPTLSSEGHLALETQQFRPVPGTTDAVAMTAPADQPAPPALSAAEWARAMAELGYAIGAIVGSDGLALFLRAAPAAAMLPAGYSVLKEATLDPLLLGPAPATLLHRATADAAAAGTDAHLVAALDSPALSPEDLEASGDGAQALGQPAGAALLRHCAIWRRRCDAAVLAERMVSPLTFTHEAGPHGCLPAVNDHHCDPREAARRHFSVASPL